MKKILLISSLLILSQNALLCMQKGTAPNTSSFPSYEENYEVPEQQTKPSLHRTKNKAQVKPTSSIKSLIKQIQRLDPPLGAKIYTTKELVKYIKKILSTIIQVIDAEMIIDEQFRRENYKYLNKKLCLPSLHYAEGCTVLHLAIIFAGHMAVRRLVEAGANPFILCIYTDPKTGHSEWLKPIDLAQRVAKDSKTTEYLKQCEELHSLFPEIYNEYLDKRKGLPDKNKQKKPKMEKSHCAIV